MWTASSHSGKHTARTRQRTRERERRIKWMENKQPNPTAFHRTEHTVQNIHQFERCECKEKSKKKREERERECTRMYISLILCAGRHIVNKIKWNDRGKGLEDSSCCTRTRRWMAQFVSLEPRINRMACRYRVHILSACLCEKEGERERERERESWVVHGKRIEWNCNWMRNSDPGSYLLVKQFNWSSNSSLSLCSSSAGLRFWGLCYAAKGPIKISARFSYLHRVQLY